MYKIEVWTKHTLQKGKRKIDLIVKLDKEDKEIHIYKSIIAQLTKHLKQKNMYSSEHFPIPQHIDSCPVLENDKTRENGLFILEDMRAYGFKRDILGKQEGLDYEHSLLTVARLARFHATSYCYVQDILTEGDTNLDVVMVERNFRKIPKIADENIIIVENLIREQHGYKQFSSVYDMLVEALRGRPLHSESQNTSSAFQSFCHGSVVRENILFQYESQLNSKLFCRDAVLQNLSCGHFGSCVFDLIQFIFTSIEAEVRQSFLADFVCSVYYDNFAKTVSKMRNDRNPKIFSKKDWIREFDSKIMFGFLFALPYSFPGLCHDRQWSDEEMVRLKTFVNPMIKDIIQFKLNARATFD